MHNLIFPLTIFLHMMTDIATLVQAGYWICGVIMIFQYLKVVTLRDLTP